MSQFSKCKISCFRKLDNWCWLIIEKTSYDLLIMSIYMHTNWNRLIDSYLFQSVFSVPSEIDLGSCLVGGVQATQLLVKNEGGTGRFCLMARSRWPTTSIRVSILLLLVLLFPADQYITTTPIFNIQYIHTVLIHVRNIWKTKII